MDLHVGIGKMGAWGLEGEGGDPKQERWGQRGGRVRAQEGCWRKSREGAGSQRDAQVESGVRQGDLWWQVDAQVGSWSLGTGVSGWEHCRLGLEGPHRREPEGPSWYLQVEIERGGQCRGQRLTLSMQGLGGGGRLGTPRGV